MSSEGNSTTLAGRGLWRGLSLALWFGILAGLVEGVGLLLCQATNWYRKPPHVSGQIIWICPVVDVSLFLLVVLACLGAGMFVGRSRALRMAVFLCMFLTLYDWLMLSGRIYYLSCVLLAAGVSAVFVRWLSKNENAVFRFWARTLPWVVALFLLAVVALRAERWEGERRALAGLPPAASGVPNVLVIVIDTLRADHLSSYGYSRPTSPNIDRLAAEGELFENAVSTSSWTFPSHVSLLSGRYLFQHGMGNIAPFPMLGLRQPSLGGWPTLSEVLESHGYRTGAFSANRFFFTGNLGFARGFSHFEDFFYSPADMFVRTLFGRQIAAFYWRRGHMRTVNRISKLLGVEDRTPAFQTDWNNNMANEGMAKRAGEVNRELLRWIDEGPRDRPFFAFVNYFDVHMPYGGPPHFSVAGWPQDTRVDHYDDGIKYVDDLVGKLLAQLDSRGVRQETIVILTSDHGESLGQHGLPGHGDALYWPTVHVPLIISYPPEVPKGARMAVPVSNASIPSTVLDLVGIAESPSFLNPSLRPLWSDPGPQSSSPLVWSELAKDVNGVVADETAVVPTATTGTMESVVTPQWHFITHSQLGDQLYNWVQDPQEMRDLIHTPQGQRVAAELRAQMQQAFAAHERLKQ